MNSPLISVIINCYNGEKYLNDAIDSVIEQSFKDWELIFWDNRSSDNSKDIFNKYNDPRMKYFLSPKFTNLSTARNQSVNVTSGKWIGFLDCDDYWLPNKLNNQVKIISNNNNDVAFIYGNIKAEFMEGFKNTIFARRINKKKENSILPSGYIFNKLLLKNFVPLSSALINKKFYLNCGGIDEKYEFSEDYDLFLKISKNNKVISLSSSDCIYRIHDSNMSQNDNTLGYKEAVSICKKYYFNIFAIIGSLLYSLKFIYVTIMEPFGWKRN